MKHPALQKPIEALQGDMCQREWSQAELAKKSGVSHEDDQQHTG